MKVSKTITEKVIQANRENSKKGTGPKTERGKGIVSQNAIKYGTYAQKLRFRNGKEKAAYNSRASQLKESIEQNDPVMQMLAEDVALQELRRGRALEMEQDAWQRHNAATDLAVKTVTRSELMGGSRFGVLDSEGGWECTELTLAAQKHAEGLNKDGAVTRNNGNGEQLQVHAKFRDPMEMALRCQRETDRAFYRALDKFLKLRAGGARIALEQSGQKNKVE